MSTNPVEWLSHHTVARLCGLSTSQFNRSIRPLVTDPSAERKRGRAVVLRARDYVRAWCEHKIAEARLPADGDELLAADGTDSPALERYRAARAGLAELELHERVGRLIPRDEYRAAGTRLSSHIQAAGMDLQVKFGPEAHQILEERLDEFDRDLDEFIAQYHSKGRNPNQTESE